MWADRFFRETGVGIGADGQPKAVLFDGAGPGNVTVTPGSYRDPDALRRAHEDAPLAVNGRTVTSEDIATRNLADRVAVRMQGAGVAADAPASAEDLRLQYDKERFVQSVKRDNARLDIEGGQQEQGRQFREAADNVSPTHVLGNQGDGRSGSQQLESEMQRKRSSQKDH